MVTSRDNYIIHMVRPASARFVRQEGFVTVSSAVCQRVTGSRCKPVALTKSLINESSDAWNSRIFREIQFSDCHTGVTNLQILIRGERGLCAGHRLQMYGPSLKHDHV